MYLISAKVYCNHIKIVVLAILVCCMSCKKDKTTSKESIDQHTIVFEDTIVQQVYAQYIKIQMALVEDATTVVQEETKVLITLLPDTKPYGSLKATAELLYLTKDIKKQRDFFVGITTQMEAIIRATSIQSGQVYKQFCPMAFEGEGGYWLSDTEEIRNPFFGHQMLHCGRIEEIIK